MPPTYQDPGFCLKCFCPPCAVYEAQGCACPQMCLACYCGYLYTVVCWNPTTGNPNANNQFRAGFPAQQQGYPQPHQTYPQQQQVMVTQGGQVLQMPGQPMPQPAYQMQMQNLQPGQPMMVPQMPGQPMMVPQMPGQPMMVPQMAGQPIVTVNAVPMPNQQNLAINQSAQMPGPDAESNKGGVETIEMSR